MPLVDWKPEAYALFIGLNPSTADETENDPTIRRCIAFARAWRYGALCMVNLFAWRDTKPAKMMEVDDPVGPLNDYYLLRLAREATIVVAAWGKYGAHLGRGDHIKSLLRDSGVDLHFLRRNDDGSPEHPLYIPADTQPRSFDSLP